MTFSINDTQHKLHSASMTLSITILYKACNYAECHYDECRNLFIIMLNVSIKFRYAECGYAECRHAKCGYARVLFARMKHSKF